MTDSTREASGLSSRLMARSERYAPAIFLMPTVLVVLFASIFPLIVSLYLSLSRFRFVKGGFELKFVGFLNYKKLLLGSQQFHFLGRFGELSLTGWVVVGLVVVLMIVLLRRYFRRGRVSAIGVIGRVLVAVSAILGSLLVISTLSPGGQPGSLIVTLFYVLFGVASQFLVGLGLAALCVQRLPGQRFFRIVFLIPMMITPVGIAYTFRMLSDTTKGPFFPIWELFGWGEAAWLTTAWGARFAVVIGDSWQWIPFMFIVLLGALESQAREPVEAAQIDGADRWQVFRYITWPAIMPVAMTLILIRTIEAFKIVDLPNVLTAGGPGIASESMTLHSFIAWRTLDLGGSAAIAYMLLIVTVIATLALVNLVRVRAREVS